MVKMDAAATVPAGTAFRHLRDGLRGPRVLVRLWSDSDAEALFAAIDRSREHLRTWMEWVDRHQDVADTRDYITRALLDFTRRDSMALGIFDRTDNRTVLGSTGFHDIDWTVPTLEIGYWVVPEAEGRGYVTEAVALLTEFALREFSANRIAIYCDPRNLRSRRVAERLGYRFEGQLRNTARTPQGALRDSLAFSLVPGEWDPGRVRASST
jgi:RimJ/RimL family protein N-acetyltransferase